jgi:hypothetical protein
VPPEDLSGILEHAASWRSLETVTRVSPSRIHLMDVPSAAKTFDYFANNLEE